MPITLTLPYPPSVNKYWRHAVIKGRNATLISAEARAYHSRAKEAIERQLGKNIMPMIGHVEFSAVIHPPDYIRRDLDNCLKAIQDTITHAKVWVDDSQVHKLHLAWGEVRKGGMVLVEISEMAPEDVKFVKPEKPAGKTSRRKKK